MTDLVKNLCFDQIYFKVIDWIVLLISNEAYFTHLSVLLNDALKSKTVSMIVDAEINK